MSLSFNLIILIFLTSFLFWGKTIFCSFLTFMLQDPNSAWVVLSISDQSCPLSHGCGLPLLFRSLPPQSAEQLMAKRGLRLCPFLFSCWKSGFTFFPPLETQEKEKSHKFVSRPQTMNLRSYPFPWEKSNFPLSSSKTEAFLSHQESLAATWILNIITRFIH